MALPNVHKKYSDECCLTFSKKYSDEWPCLTFSKKYSDEWPCLTFSKKYSDEWPCLTFSKKYSDEWPFSKQSDYFGFSTLCNVDFCVSHAGRNDCQKHIATDKHSRAAEHVKKTPKITSFSSFNLDTSVTNAEVTFVDFLIEHNIPIAASDHAGRLFKMFPDSKIAKQY